MRYKLLLLDIDGTLRPGSCEQKTTFFKIQHAIHQ